MKKKWMISAAALLLILLVLLVGLYQRCDRKNIGDTTATDERTIGRPYTITYIVNFFDTQDEPTQFQLETDVNGRVIIPPSIEDVEGSIWSGWLTQEEVLFDFDTPATGDMTLHSNYLPDENNNDLVDGTVEDPIVVYQFWHSKGFVMQANTVFGSEEQSDYQYTNVKYPASPDDGQIFLGWLARRTADQDGGRVTVDLTPDLAPDRNNNDLVDGTTQDPYVYYIFLKEDGSVLKEVEWLTGDRQIFPEDVVYPVAEQQEFMGWEKTESVNEDGFTVHTYTPQLTQKNP